MERKLYSLTEKQTEKAERAIANPVQMPSDETFKARGKKERKPWGILKRDWVKANMSTTADYQQGLWQGMVDKANGVEYSLDALSASSRQNIEERNDSTYNMGYYIGWNNYESNRKGWDSATTARFDSLYINN